MHQQEDNIESLRNKIDKIDQQIVELLIKRVSLSKQIGRIKKERNELLYSPAREKEIIQRVKSLSKDEIHQKSVEIIFREIISACRASVQLLKIAYLGPEGSFSHQAAISCFASQCIYLPITTIKDVFLSIQKNESDFGVVPIENSQEGTVLETLDMFMEMPVKICKELLLDINLCLASNVKKENIKMILSHPLALKQCKRFLEENFKQVEIKEVNSTAEAARVARFTKNTAAICSKQTALIYKLKILQENIQDSLENLTRFFVIGKDISKPTGKDKTSLLFSIKDKPGALYQALSPFAKNNINLKKIESRPSKRQPFEYIFFVDFEGHIEDKSIKVALEELKEFTLFFKILGSYPASML